MKGLAIVLARGERFVTMEKPELTRPVEFRDWAEALDTDNSDPGEA